MAATISAQQENAETAHSVAVAAPRTSYKINNKKGYLFTKRLFDIVISLLAGIVLMIPMALVALIIVLDSPGPAIYKQERLGKNGKPFMMYKFRSMYTDAEKNGPQWAKTEDPRCTRVGKCLRRLHIDELPQLINVLKGEMSIVGPRPEREYFYQMFEEDLPYYRDRMLVQQGLTCIGQVTLYDENLTPENKIACDVEYIKTQSLWTDIKCIVKTVGAIFKNKGE